MAKAHLRRPHPTILYVADTIAEIDDHVIAV
jgi:hypothetical protein